MPVNPADEEIRFPCRRDASVWYWVGAASPLLFMTTQVIRHGGHWFSLISYALVVFVSIAVWFTMYRTIGRPLWIGTDSAGFPSTSQNRRAFDYVNVTEIAEFASHIVFTSIDPDTTTRSDSELRRHWFSAPDWDRLVPLLKARVLAANPEVTIRTPIS